MSNKNQTKTNQPQLTGILGIIERTGNKIPHPIYMFIAFFFIVSHRMGRFQPNWSSICRNPWTRRGKWERFFKWHASPRQQF